MHPRTAALWVPLVVGYWRTLGMRASFFVPSEHASSWTFRVNAAGPATPVWAAVRAAMIAFILPRALLANVLLAPLIGWHAAAWHAVVVAAVVVLFIELVALTIDYVPFTQPYRPGHISINTAAAFDQTGELRNPLGDLRNPRLCGATCWKQGLRPHAIKRRMVRGPQLGSEHCAS
jgi:hypothetical protein